MSESLVQIEKLDLGNYDNWSIQMRSVLIHSGLWQIVNGSIKKEGDAAVVSQWVSDDVKALASISLNMAPTPLKYIMGCTSSHHAWTRLQAVYKSICPVEKVSLYKRLVNLKMPENGSVVLHINEFSEAYEKLKEAGTEIQEELLIIMLMSSLPREYDNFVIALETADALPSLSSLKTKLLVVEKRREEEATGSKSRKRPRHPKTSITLDVIPWDEDVPLDLMEEDIRKIKPEGLMWGASTLVAVATGVNKLHINCVIEGDKVSVDWLIKEIERNEDFIERVDVDSLMKY